MNGLSLHSMLMLFIVYNYNKINLHIYVYLCIIYNIWVMSISSYGIWKEKIKVDDTENGLIINISAWKKNKIKKVGVNAQFKYL